MKRIALLLFLSCFSALPLRALPDTAAQKTDGLKLGIVLGVSAGVFAVTQVEQYRTYWSDSEPFHIMEWHNEYDDALMADKFGHCFFTYTAANNYRSALEWTGMDTLDAAYWSAGLAWAFQLYVEIHDGHSGGAPYLGFSRLDIAANTLGAAYFIAQQHVPILRNGIWKLSYWPSDEFRAGTADANSIFNDYTSTYHWFSVNPAGLLGEAKPSWLPSWLNLAVGHSVKGIDRFGAGNHELYCSLDVDFTRLLPQDTWLLRSLSRALNMYKLPLPSLRILPGMAARWQ
jgi:hypothetical protein